MPAPPRMSLPAGAAASQRFPRDRRIRRRGEFQQVFERGTRIHGRSLTLLLMPRPGPGPRLGVVASKKLGGSVSRNRAKRLIRETFRRCVQAGDVSVDAVVIPRAELLDIPFETLQQDFRNAWRRGLQRIGHART